MESERGWDAAAWSRGARAGVACALRASAGSSWRSSPRSRHAASRACRSSRRVCLAANALRAADAGGEGHLRRLEAGRGAGDARVTSAVASTARAGRARPLVLSGEAKGTSSTATPPICLVVRGRRTRAVALRRRARRRGVTRRRSPRWTRRAPWRTVTLRDVAVPASARIGTAQRPAVRPSIAPPSPSPPSRSGAPSGASRWRPSTRRRASSSTGPSAPSRPSSTGWRTCSSPVETARSAAYWAAVGGRLGDDRRAPRRRRPRQVVLHRGVLPLRRRVHPDPRRHRLHLGARRASLPQARRERRSSLLGSPSRDREAIARATLGSED